MTIQKQEFYLGAALFQLLKCKDMVELQYEPPFFIVNGRIRVYLKYSTAVRSPWGFTFSADERELLNTVGSNEYATVIGLICGSDGIAAVSFESVNAIATTDGNARITCHRKHGGFFELAGSAGKAEKKISPAAWSRLTTL